jgi:hypothetical protein
MITELLTITDAAYGGSLPVTTRHLFAQIINGVPAVHNGSGQFTPVANDLNGSWSYQRFRGNIEVTPSQLSGDPCAGVRMLIPLRIVALLPRDTCIADAQVVAASLRGASKAVKIATGAQSVSVDRVTWNVAENASAEFNPAPQIPTTKALLIIDLTVTVEASQACISECEPTDVVCAIIAKASNAKVVECLGTERVNQICNTDCPATTVNGEESDTPTITVLQGGIEVGTLNPATGVVTIEECPEGCTDPYTIKWDVDGTEITILVDEDPCGGEAVLSCDTLIDAVVVEGAGTDNVNGLYVPDPAAATDPSNPPSAGSTIYSLVTDGINRTLYQTVSPVWSIYCPVSMDFLYEDNTGAAVDPWDGEWVELIGDAPAPTVRQATIGDLCGGAPVPCEDASVTWDGEPLLTIPSGGTQDLDCNTLVNAAYAVDGGSVTGTYKPDGTLNSREVFRLDPTHNFQYTGTRWRLVKPGSDYDAALGSETKPWDADWTATPVTVTQATIGAYCDDCVPCDDANVEINGTAFDSVAAGGTLDIPVVNTAATPVGTVNAGVDVVVPDATYQLKDSAAGNIGSPGAIASGASANITAPDGSFQVRDSAGNAIGSPVAVRSNQTGVTATAPDGTAVVKNLNGTTLVTEAILSNASENITAPIPLKFAWGAGNADTLTFTVTDDEAGTYANYTQDGASGTITYSKNGAAYATVTGSISLAIGDTIRLRRTTPTSQGFSRWAL